MSYPAAFLFSFRVEKVRGEKDSRERREREGVWGQAKQQSRQQWFYLLWWLMCVEAAICRSRERERREERG